LTDFVEKVSHGESFLFLQPDQTLEVVLGVVQREARSV
jgi:hypothetical protein